MKRCPACNRTYSDEQTFCTDDGTTLVGTTMQNDPAATAVYSGTPTQPYGSNAAPGYQPPPSPPGMFPPPPGGPYATNTTNKFQPALIGGLVLGLLSSIPFVNYGNLLCCLWVIIGGVVATYLYVKKSPQPVQLGEGAILGAIAGGIGFVVQVFVGIPLNILAGNPLARDIVEWAARMNPEQGERALREYERLTNAPFMDQLAAAFTPLLLVSLIIFVAFSTAGGLIGVPLFEKRKAQQTPPPMPPPGFGGR